MLVRVLLTILVICLSGLTLKAQKKLRLQEIAGKVMFHEVADNEYQLRSLFKKNKKDNVRLTAIALNVSLGLLGVHRLYLGTDVKIAAAYALTCGGGCILWLVDLGLLIGTKDITPFMNNPRLFMWTIED